MRGDDRSRPDSRGLADVHARLAGAEHRPAELGRYRLLEPMGIGATGTVWTALDPATGSEVAIKVLHPGSPIAGAPSQRRLLRQARAICGIRHPNIVSILDVGGSEHGVFLVMQRLEGPNATAWILEGHPWADVLRRLAPMARGLAMVHQRGVLHRDIKPDNIMWSGDQLVLTDFGFGITEASLDEDATSEGDLGSGATGRFGTPAYMAPEQHEGRADARSDVYSLSMVLWEALAGKSAFRGTPTAELVAQKRAMNFPSLSDRGVPRWLRRALLVGLAPDPDERYPSMSRLAAALVPPARRRATWVLAATVAVGAAIGLHALVPSPATTTAARVAQSRDPTAPVMSPTAAAVSTLALLADVQQRDGEFESAAHTIDAAVAWAESAHDARARLEALAARGSWLNATGDLTQAETVLTQAYFLAVVQQEPRIAVDSAARLVHATAQRGAHDDARTWLAAGRSWAGRRPPAEASARLSNSEGSLLAAEGRYEEAASAFEDAIWGWKASLEPQHPHVALALSNLGTVRAWQGRYEDALGSYNEALEIRVAQLGPTHSLVADSYLELGTTRANMGDFEGALADYREALAIQETIHGPGALETARTLDEIGLTLAAMGSLPQAIVHHRDAIHAVERSGGPEHADLVVPLTHLGQALLEHGDLASAEVTSARSLAIAEASLGPAHLRTAAALELSGQVQRRRIRPAQAEALFVRSLRIREASLGPLDPLVARSLIGVGECQLEQGRTHDAVRSFERALAIRETNGLPPDQLAEARFALARAVAALGTDFERARALAHAASTAFRQAGDQAGLAAVGEATQHWPPPSP